jgi:hypothetical protein
MILQNLNNIVILFLIKSYTYLFINILFIFDKKIANS